MTARRSTRARTALAALLAVSVCGLAACGSSADTNVTLGDGGDDGAAASSTATSSASPTESASVTASPSGPRTYTSDLEDRPPVKAARAWAAAVAEEVNARSSDHAQTRPLTTARAQRTLPARYEDDYAYRYPGPLPFGPQGLVVDGRTASLTACVTIAGWGVQRGTGQATGSPVYAEYTMVLRRAAGVWKMDQFKATGAECSAADVRGTR